MYYNPFSHLSIKDAYPLAKVRRSTLWERFEDTFEVFNGRIVEYKSKPDDVNVKFKESHLGVLDYLLFPMLIPLMGLLKNRPDSNLTKFVMGSKAIISFFLTVSCFLFVLIGHGISLSVNTKRDENKVKNLNIITDKQHTEENEKIEYIGSTPTKTETKRVIVERRIIEDKNCMEKLWSISPCEQRLEDVTYKVITKQINTEKKELYILIDNIDNGDWFPYSDYRFYNVKIPMTSENKAGIRWMLESNYTHILEKLPDQDLQDLVKEIDESVKPQSL